MTHHFVALDFELANPSHASICSVGVARVVASEVSAPRDWFIRPPAPYDFLHPVNARLTGIRSSDLAGAAGFDFWGPNILRNLGDGVLVGHGVLSADLSMFEQSWGASGLGVFPAVPYVDTQTLARQVLPGLGAYRLDVLCEEVLGEPMVGHHTAGADAHTTARIAVALLDIGALTVQDVAQVRSARWPRQPKPPRRGPGCRQIRTTVTPVAPATHEDVH